MNDESFKMKAPELLQDMAAHVQTVLVEYGQIDPIKASSLGEEAAERVARAWGGATIYFPKGDYIHSHRMAQNFWSEYMVATHRNLPASTASLLSGRTKSSRTNAPKNSPTDKGGCSRQTMRENNRKPDGKTLA